MPWRWGRLSTAQRHVMSAIEVCRTAALGGHLEQCESGDMDWSEGILTIRGAKFGKFRLVPLHTSTCNVLANYAKRRNERFGVLAEGPFLVNLNGNHIRGIVREAA
jgi:integrase